MATQPIHPLKSCTKCGQAKPLTREFFFLRGPRHGKGPVWELPCLGCMAERRKSYYRSVEKARRGGPKAFGCKSCGKIVERITSKQKRCQGCQSASRKVYLLEAGHNRRGRERQAEGQYTRAEFHAVCLALGWRCFYCQKQLSLSTVTADHKTPLIRGGTNWIENIVPACRRCNSQKYNRTVEEYLAWREARLA